MIAAPSRLLDGKERMTPVHEPVRVAIVRFLESISSEHRPRALDGDAAALAIYNTVQWNATQAIMSSSDEKRSTPTLLGSVLRRLLATLRGVTSV